MNALQKSAVALAGFAALALPSAGVAAPAAKGQTPPPRMMAQHFYAPIFEKERYDSVLSLNDHCPVKHGKLNTNIRPTYINRQPVGFC